MQAKLSLCCDFTGSVMHTFYWNFFKCQFNYTKNLFHVIFSQNLK